MKSAWVKWKKIAKKFGNIQANIFLSFIYILIILPIALFFKLSGKFRNYNFKTSGYWLLRKKVKQDISWARKQ